VRFEAFSDEVDANDSQFVVCHFAAFRV